MRRMRLSALSSGTAERIVHFGSWQNRLPCDGDEAADRLSLPLAAIEEVGLEPGVDLHVLLCEDGQHVHVGPLMGVMLGPADMPRLQSHDRYRLMVKEAKAAGAFPLFFDLAGLDHRSTTIRGWVERGDQWQTMVCPLPDVIYNRATYSSREESLAATRALAGLIARRQTRLLNGVNAFSKIDVHDALRFFPETADLTPETRLLSGLDDLSLMLDRHPAVFVKGNHSSHGSDVVRLRIENGGWSIQGKIAARTVDERFEHPEQLFAFLQLLTPRGDWVVQQGIALPTIEGRLFDIRVIAQKDGLGEWAIPLILVRLAQAGYVAANMSQGGEPFLPDRFRQQYGERLPCLADLTEKVTNASLRTLHALESRFGRLGEVGIDIGLDQQGSPWVFEANTKPLHPRVPDMPENQLVRHPFAYGIHLAHQAWIGRYSGLPSPVLPRGSEGSG